MVSTEKAFDMIPHAVSIVEKLDIKNYIVQNKHESKEEQESKGFDFVMFALKNVNKIKNEVFELLAIMNETTAEEIKVQPFAQTIQQFKTLLENKDLMGFFLGAMR